MTEGTGVVQDDVDDAHGIKDALHMAYQRALADAYPDPRDEPGFPLDVEIDVSVTFEEK